MEEKLPNLTPDGIVGRFMNEMNYDGDDGEFIDAVKPLLKEIKEYGEQERSAGANLIRNTVLWCIDSTSKRPPKTVLRLLKDALSNSGEY